MAIKVNGWLKRVGLVALIISVLILLADRVMGVGALQQTVVHLVESDKAQNTKDAKHDQDIVDLKELASEIKGQLTILVARK